MTWNQQGHSNVLALQQLTHDRTQSHTNDKYGKERSIVLLNHLTSSTMARRKGWPYNEVAKKLATLITTKNYLIVAEAL